MRTFKTIANELTILQRDLLIRHLDAKVPIVVKATRREASGEPNLWSLQRTLIEQGLLRYAEFERRNTMLTERGRAALAEILGNWADAIDRAQRAQAATDALPVERRIMANLEVFKSDRTI